jgi:hypothetical protein
LPRPANGQPTDVLGNRRGYLENVLLHHDDVLVAILGGAVAPERRGNLLWLPLVVLFDLNPDVDAVGDRRRIDVEDAGDAGAVQDVRVRRAAKPPLRRRAA